MNLINIYKYICLIVCVCIRLSLTIPLIASNSISLYNESDKLTILNSENLFSTIYPSKTAWLVEFYASWCGHCQSYAKTYREIGINTWAWQSVVRIGAINCYGGNNTPVCRQHSVRGYPSLLLIPPNAIFNQSKVISIPATNAKDLEIEIIKGLESFNLKNSTWPRFVPTNRFIMEELFEIVPKSTKLLLIVVEQREDFTGRQLMLDFSKYHSQISIFRTTTDGKLSHKFPVNYTDVPALFVILRNRTVQRLDFKQNSTSQINSRQLFKQLITSYIQEKNLIDHFQINTPHTISQIIPTKSNVSDDTRDQFTVHKKVHMLDLELALSYMFRYEIPQIDRIQGETYTALKQWLSVLIKYFPGREQLIMHLKFIYSKLDENSQGLTGNHFREIFDMESTNVYFPNDRQQYQHCAGSSSQFRGYPCALWTLFHTLTVSQYLIESKLSNPVDVYEIPLAVKNYVKYFFSCRKCSENFMKETANINLLNLTNKQEAILYFWKIHNHVNERLSFDVTEDPKHPKVQFPSKYLCQTCRTNDQREYDLIKTMDFLLEYYSKENIDQSIPRNNVDLKEDVPEFLLSKDSRIEFVIDGPGYFTRTLQRYSIYLFFGLLLLIIFIRRRYCHTTTRRLYTAKRIL